MSKSIKHLILEVAGLSVPLKVVAEPRRNGRVSIGKRTVILRYPDSIFGRGEAFYIDWAKAWLETQFDAAPEKFARFTGANIRNSITIYGDQYIVHIEKAPLDAGKLYVKGDTISLAIPEDLTEFDAVEMRRRLLSKFAAKRYRPQLVADVNTINNKYYGVLPINSVRLKYNRSNWGSCSSKGNINLSTRLLLVPAPEREYVIIHELAHLLEMNHSSKFYEIVESHCPDYKAREAWLDSNYIDF